jgi:hypothetical protein
MKASSPMNLGKVHQLLISAALGLAVLFAARSSVLFARGAGSMELVLAIASAGVAVALGVYLRRFRRKFGPG